MTGLCPVYTGPIIQHMKLKAVVIIIVAIALIALIGKFFGGMAEKYEGSESYIDKSIKAVKNVEALKEERTETVSEQESEIHSWE